MPFWLILVVILVAAAMLLARRRTRRRDAARVSGEEWGDGSHHVGERWRTGGYGG